MYKPSASSPKRRYRCFAFICSSVITPRHSLTNLDHQRLVLHQQVSSLPDPSRPTPPSDG